MQITSAKQAKTLSPSHMKQCILSESRFDFLKDLVKNLPDASGPDEDVQTPPATPGSAVPVPLPQTQTMANFPAVSSRSSSVSGFSSARDTPSFAQMPARRHSVDKGKPAKSVESNEAALSSSVPKFKMSVPTSFNASQPNFYTEVHSNSSDNVPQGNSINQPVSNFACTADIDEDYDT
ncbi:hypothetical protein QAD02_017561 [Eretmocerus hayati]|uniref:Uncharacterized protein n=1 Tax=Eretmocerus hayati TaxID=131215 RepID=A0ACC2PGQ5_9HYME|nr:hypothetical protein QAD02_017561 [Eretmocerus hayati]